MCCGCTDHGEDNTEHRMTGKNTMYEAAARVPMILTGPGVTPNTVIPALASLYDVCTCNDSPWPSFSVMSESSRCIDPTVMDLMGLKDKT